MGIRLTAHSHSSNLMAVYELCYMEFLGRVDISGDKTFVIYWNPYLCKDLNLYGKKNAFIVAPIMWSTMAWEVANKDINAMIVVVVL